MARDETDREDLIREAVALTNRAELKVDGWNQQVTVGFRSTRALSVFFGQDPVYQFDTEHRLRRAFVDGCLFRSQHNTLARLNRERTDSRTLLLRTDLHDEDLTRFRDRMHSSLQSLLQAIQDGMAVVSRSVPAEEDADFLPQVAVSLQLAINVDPWLSREIRRRV